MADYTLTATPPLAGFDVTMGNARLYSPAGLALVSIALPLGKEDAAMKAVKTAFGVDLPAPGKSALGKNETRLVRLNQDQAMAIFCHETPDAESHINALLKSKAYTTDQTDAWVGLTIEGKDARASLERICQIDLHSDAFAVNDAARTVMEHLGVLIIRTEVDQFLLLSASSSATSFLHAVETSMKNVS